MHKKQVARYPLIVMETLRKHKVMFFVTLCFFMFIILALLDYFTSETFKNGFWGGVLVEAHGMFLDIILFGILLTLYEKFTEKKNEIDRLTEEIDDYRGWNEPEAMYRIVGCIKRLSKKGVTKFDLKNCFLKNGEFSSTDFSGSFFTNTNLEGTKFYTCKMNNCLFQDFKVLNTYFSFCSFPEAIFFYNDLSEIAQNNIAVFKDSDLNDSFLIIENILFHNFNEQSTEQKIKKVDEIKNTLSILTKNKNISLEQIQQFGNIPNLQFKLNIKNTSTVNLMTVFSK